MILDDNIEEAVRMSLFTDSWYGDTGESIVLNGSNVPDSGLKKYLRLKQTPENVSALEKLIRAKLQWMTDERICHTITVAVSAKGTAHTNINITIDNTRIRL